MPMDFNSLSENAQNKAFEDWWQEQLSLYSEDVIQDMYPDEGPNPEYYFAQEIEDNNWLFNADGTIAQ